MTLRLLHTSIFAMATAGSALTLFGCGQGSVSAASGDSTTASIDEALNAVRDCQTAARECASDALGTTCDDELRACLSVAATTHGGSTHVKDDAAVEVEDDDGGVSHHRDAAAMEHARDDAGDPRSSNERDAEPAKSARDGGGSPVAPCIDELHACLDTAARPATCAHAAVACMSLIRDARKQ